MWFKNLTVYRLPAGWSVAAAELEERLSQRVLQACAPFEMRSQGWAPVGPSNRFVHTVQGQHLIALATDQKILPAAVIKQRVQAKAAIVAEEQGYPVGRRQLRELKESVTQDLLTRALTKVTAVHAWIDPEHGWLVVDTASSARAEEVVSALRDALGTFAVTLLECEKSPMLAMASWLRDGDAPLRFSIDQDLELQGLLHGAKSKVKYSQHDLGGKEILEHLHAGKVATQLGLTWNDRVAFKLTEKGQIKRLQFLEITEDSSAEERDPVEQFDIDFALMTGELGALIQDLIAGLGGEVALEKTASAGTSKSEEEIFAAAVDVVTACPDTSVSRLQRQMSIGYNHAARIIERMEVAGIVGPMQPGGARKVNFYPRPSQDVARGAA